MKILLIASFPDSIISFRGALVKSILAAGHEVHIASPGLAGGSTLRFSLEAFGVIVHDIPLRRTGISPIGDIGLMLNLFRLMRHIRPALVLSYTIKPVIYGSLVAWLARVPRRFALVTGLGFAFTGDRNGILMRLIRLLYRIALNRTSLVFFQNPDDQALFHRLGILSVNSPSVVVNGSGVDLAAFSPQLLPEGRPTFLMIGRLLGDKGVREYVQAAQRVSQKYPGTCFRLVGWLDENPDAIKQSELDAWVSRGSVDFLGRMDDVRPAIAESTVYVLPSYREGTPRTVLEAMAMGRPVITTDAPGCRETVSEGQNGFLVPVKSVDALAAAMVRFVEDAALAPRMGARSRQIAEEKYDVHKVNEIMLREMGIALGNAERMKERE